MRRAGLLRELSDRQLDVKELLDSFRKLEDKTITTALASNLGHDDEQVIAVVLTKIEMSQHPDREITEIDLIWAGEFIDHLATQGYEIRRKARTRGRPRTALRKLPERVQ